MSIGINFLFISFCIYFSSGKISRYKDSDNDNGGHSSEYRPRGYSWNTTDFEYTPDLIHKIHTLHESFPSGNLSRSIDFMSFITDLLRFFKALPEVVKELETDLDRILRKNRINGIVTGRIKSLQSLLSKMERVRINDYRDVTDIVACRVTLQTLNDISKFKSAYLRAFNKSVTEIRCYGTCGPTMKSSDPRVKIYWPWKGTGYRRLHFKVALPQLQTEAEIQVGTPYMTLWADWQHALVYKGPKELQKNNDIQEYAQRLAEYYMMLDNIRDRNNPECPQILKKMNAKEIFSEQERKTFGFPLNACHIWSDLSINIPSFDAQSQVMFNMDPQP